MRAHPRWASWAIGLFLLVAALPQPAHGQAAGVTVTPNPIVISAVKDTSEPGATLTIMVLPGITSLDFFVSDLRNTTSASTTQPVVLARQISVAPSALTEPRADTLYQVAVTVANVTQAGTWAGTLTLHWRGATTGTLAVPLTLSMATIPSLVLKSPPAVVISGVRGQPVAARHVTLHETTHGSAVGRLTVYPRDLLNADQTETLPRSAISVTLSTDLPGVIAGGGRGDVVVGLDLQRVRSGSYSGNLVVQSSAAADVLIPLVVSVKDPPLWAILCLVLGVVLGFGITIYRSAHLPRDQLRGRIDALEQFAREHPDFDAQFGRYQRSNLREAIDHLAVGQLAEAQAPLTTAERRRTAWLVLGSSVRAVAESLTELLQRIDAAPGAIQALPAMQALRALIATAQSQDLLILAADLPTFPTRIADLQTGWDHLPRRSYRLECCLIRVRSSSRKVIRRSTSCSMPPTAQSFCSAPSSFGTISVHCPP